MAQQNPSPIQPHVDHQDPDSRRGFLRDSSMLLAGAMPAGFPGLQAAAIQSQRPNALRIGLVGCGRRGMQLVRQLLADNPSSRLVAAADIFADSIQRSLRALKSSCREQVQVTGAARFVGLDAYQQLLEHDCDTVVLAGCPASRPEQAWASAVAGKNIVAARPVAVDASGIDLFQQAIERCHNFATKIQVPNELKRKSQLVEATEQINQGAIGRLISLRALANSRPLPRFVGVKGGLEAELQLRNWQHFGHLSGGGMLEELVDTLDVCNGIVGSGPIDAQAMLVPLQPASAPGASGGSDVSDVSGPNCGNAEQLAAEFRYRRGVRLNAYWRRSSNAWSGPTLSAHGTQGWCDILAGKIYDASDAVVWRAEESAHVTRLDASNSCPLAAAAATLTAILARQAGVASKRLSLSDVLA